MNNFFGDTRRPRTTALDDTTAAAGTVLGRQNATLISFAGRAAVSARAFPVGLRSPRPALNAVILVGYGSGPPAVPSPPRNPNPTDSPDRVPPDGHRARRVCRATRDGYGFFERKRSTAFSNRRRENSTRGCRRVAGLKYSTFRLDDCVRTYFRGTASKK